jgi:hypothetical protein
MTLRFIAQVAGVDEDSDHACLSAGVSENLDGTGFALIFQCSLREPDEQDVALGMDSYCVVTAEQGTDYGCVTEVILKDNLLRVVVTPEATEPLGLDDTEIEATLDLDGDVIEQLRDGLRRILNYGRLSARPTTLQI